MVYKKIKSISSISSLLLAGVLFSGCPGGDPPTPSDSEQNQGDGNNKGNDGSNAVANTNTNNSNTNQANANANTQAGGGQKQKGPVDQFLAEAIKKFKHIFMKDCAGLKYLDTAPPSDIKDYIKLDDLDSNSDAKAKKAACEVKATIMTTFLRGDKPFPVSPLLKKHMDPLSNITKTRFFSNHPFACVSLVAAIVRPFLELYYIKEKHVKSIDDGVQEASQPGLMKELDDLEDKVDKIFDPNYKFIDNSKGAHTLLTGASLCRFFNGKSKRNKDYDGVKRLMQDTITECWVKFRAAANTRYAISNSVNINEAASLSRRGIPILADWEVEGGEKGDKFFPLTGINNTNYESVQGDTLSARFVSVSGTKDDVSGTEDDKKCLQPVLSADLASIQFNADASMIAKNIQIGQLLFFTLAKGKSKCDFIQILPSTESTADGNSTRVKIIGNNDKYILWKKEADAGNEAFAEFLGNYIDQNPDLSSLFIIPDQDTIELAIFKDIDESKAANSGANARQFIRGDANASPAVQRVDAVFGEEGEVIKLSKNILNVFSSFSQDVSGNPGELMQKLKKLGALSSEDNFKKADLTLMQRLLVKIAKEITDNSKKSQISDLAVGSARALKELVRVTINEELQKAVVKKQNGKYHHTNITTKIKDAVVLFDKQLDLKNSNAAVTYSEIASDTKVGGDFSITGIHDQLIKDIQSARLIIQSDPSAVIKIPVDQKVNYAAHFQSIPGITPLVDKDFDQIRQDYHSKANK